MDRGFQIGPRRGFDGFVELDDFLCDKKKEKPISQQATKENAITKKSTRHIHDDNIKKKEKTGD